MLAEERARRDAELRKKEAEAEAERLRNETAKREREAEIAALPGKLAAAKQALETAQDKLSKVKASKSRYVYREPTPPDDYFDAGGKYIFYTAAQKAARTTALQKDIDRLLAEIPDLEMRIKATKP
ncbi:hypothetical protein R5W23_006172 [Gemmata sp. JC673]|uniref:Uncharacterized protein n=1 Tax=Gemmata algarum TaxID=2975278 RepID=A0ABU5EUK3_9BACT|nr:hypothetical protein [Gemmata algarum]MDY3558982.1 hypothetical protein [Gemmata algarum]